MKLWHVTGKAGTLVIQHVIKAKDYPEAKERFRRAYPGREIKFLVNYETGCNR